MSERPADDRAQEQQSYRGYCDILCKALAREETRREKNYAESDRLRAELADLGAECKDKEHWFTFNGLAGSYDLSRPIGPQEIQYVCLEREEARRDRMYDQGDALRDWLQDQGVRVEDKTHTFAIDETGVRGSYDLLRWTPVTDTHGAVGGPWAQEAQKRTHNESTSWGAPSPSQKSWAPTLRPTPGQARASGTRGRDPPPSASQDYRQGSSLPPPRNNTAPISRGPLSTARPDSRRDVGGRDQTQRTPADARDAFTARSRGREQQDPYSARAPKVSQVYSEKELEAARQEEEDLAVAAAVARVKRQRIEAAAADAGAKAAGTSARAPATDAARSQARQPYGRDVADANEKKAKSFKGYCEILCMALKREEIRREHDYKRSDELRSDLGGMGVQCNDTKHTFAYGDLWGSYDLSGNIGSQELQFVCLEREEARREKNYDASDALRDWLSDQGVRVDDKAREFFLPDGSSGSFDLDKWHPIADAHGNIAPRPIGKRARHS